VYPRYLENAVTALRRVKCYRYYTCVKKVFKILLHDIWVNEPVTYRSTNDLFMMYAFHVL